MISIVDSTTEKVSKPGVSFQLDLHQNKRASLAVRTQLSLSSFYTPLMGCVLPFVYPNRTPLLSCCRLRGLIGHYANTTEMTHVESSKIHKKS